MNDAEFIELYTEITGCSEDRARSVFMLMLESLRGRGTTGQMSGEPLAGGRRNQPAVGPPETIRMP